MAVQKIKNYKEKKFNFFYKITNDFDDCYYYGIHSTNNMDDGYMGSGKRLCNAKRKHGKEHFIRTVLVFFDTRLEAAQYEFEFLTPEILSDPNCYNIAEGGGGGDTFSGMTDEEYESVCKKMSEALKGKFAGENNGMYGKTHSSKSRAKIAKAKKGKALSDEHKKNIGIGTKKRCEDPKYREKMSKIQKKRFENEESKKFMKQITDKYWENQEAHEKARKNAIIVGARPDVKAKRRKKMSAKKWVNNGVKGKRVNIYELDEFLTNNPGWVLGRLLKKNVA